jgi:glycosyltransferase involved in cell wall biosynthesis
VPAFREEAGIRSSVKRIAAALGRIDRYEWEIVVVDDGSGDGTCAEVEQAAREIDVPVRLVRHLINQGLGGALRTGFAATTGAVVITLDSDLSYHESHISRLVDAWEQTHAHVVIASAYMEGGRSTGVPPSLERRSRVANKILSVAALDDIKTLTGMVRAYDGPFVRGLSLKAVDVDINVEILYKTQLLRGAIVEIPAHLDWSGLAERAARSNVLSRRSRWNTAKSLVLTYMFRPFWFPLAPALLLGVLAGVLAAFGQLGWHGLAVSATVLSVLLAVMALGMLQAKRYFEEVYFQLTRTHGRPGSAAFSHPYEVTEPGHAGPTAEA